jgi:hypothetical protein
VYITYRQVHSATLDVQRDLYKSGFWFEDSRLYNATVFWTLLPSKETVGVFYHGTRLIDRLAGFKEGSIFIPAITLSQLLTPRERISLRDVIRHEYGHAFAHYYPELIIDSVQFMRVFSGNYFASEPKKLFELSSYVSSYAQSSPMEDFAETFMVYVRRHGKPFKHMNERLEAKWMFVDGLKDVLST